LKIHVGNPGGNQKIVGLVRLVIPIRMKIFIAIQMGFNLVELAGEKQT